MLSQPSHSLFSRITQALKHCRFPSHTPLWTTNGKPFCQPITLKNEGFYSQNTSIFLAIFTQLAGHEDVGANVE
ncbi:hypothetical protein ES332_A06G195800v1 [Gossypium tomentosum]|uniref:Uncharacterized protein n=1 Tax=Gossypium tomentosum TaxID=34277 RepID=A0A5D2Q6E7_GOSTO|nr:hypothetical protein ES332_A06G195800v1 [Gossypium tomentosum]